MCYIDLMTQADVIQKLKKQCYCRENICKCNFLSICVILNISPTTGDLVRYLHVSAMLSLKFNKQYTYFLS